MINKFIGIGHLCQDPKPYQINDKTKVAFSIGINNNKDDVLFLNVECWNKVADNCKRYLSKGSCVYVEGKVKNSNWEDKQGIKRTNFFVSADIVRFLPNGKKDSGTEINIEKSFSKPNIPDIVSELEDPPF